MQVLQYMLYISILIGLVFLISLGSAWLVLNLMKKIDKNSNEDKMPAVLERLAIMTEQSRALSEQNNNLRNTLDSKLSETHRTTQEQFSQTIRTVQGISGQSAKQLADVISGLTKLEETNKQVVGFSAQLQNLQDILQNPKRRGILGEFYLESVLKNVLPPAVYQMQYKMGKDDEGKDLIVDAVIFLQDKVIPIDSKFSLENYNRVLECKDSVEREKIEKAFKQDLKNRIDETAKYIQPKKDTMDFALMFIPSEAIFYDLLVNKVGETGVNASDLIEYAGKKKVNIVSPNSFYAFLQTILQGLRQMQVEKSTKEIIKRVQSLGTHIQKYEAFLSRMGNNLSNTVGSYESARKEFVKIDKDVIKIGGEERDLIETVEVDKPKIEE